MLNLLLAFQEHAADAADAHGHGQHAQVLELSNWLPGVTALIVFAISFAILAVFVWPKITRALDEREQKIRSEIAQAELAREQAKAALAEYQKSLAQARDEANSMIIKAKADAKAVAEDLRSRNAAEMAEMKQRATREIESAKQAAIAELHAEASNLAVAIAGKILQREVNDRDQDRLMEESVGQLARSG